LETWAGVLGGKASLAALTAALVVLALLPAAASGKPGALDPSFGRRGRVVTKADLGGPNWLSAHVNIAGAPRGGIVAAVGKQIFRYLPDGKLDPSFGEGGRLMVANPKGLPFSLHDVAVDREGRVYVLG